MRPQTAEPASSPPRATTSRAPSTRTAGSSPPATIARRCASAADRPSTRRPSPSSMRTSRRRRSAPALSATSFAAALPRARRAAAMESARARSRPAPSAPTTEARHTGFGRHEELQLPFDDVVRAPEGPGESFEVRQTVFHRGEREPALHVKLRRERAFGEVHGHDGTHAEARWLLMAPAGAGLGPR